MYSMGTKSFELFFFFGCRGLLIHKMFKIVLFIFLVDFKDLRSLTCLHKKLMRCYLLCKSANVIDQKQGTSTTKHQPRN